MTSTEKRLAEILDEVIRYYGLTKAEICSPARPDSFALPRQVFCWLARQLTNASTARMARFIHRKQAAASHCIHAAKDRMETDPKLYNAVMFMRERLARRFQRL